MTLSLISKLGKAAFSVYQMADKAEHNQRFAKDLKMMVKACMSIIEQTDETKITPALPHINMLQVYIERSSEFLKKYTKSNWLMKLMKSTGMMDEFKQLKQDLANSNVLITSSLQIHQVNQQPFSQATVIEMLQDSISELRDSFIRQNQINPNQPMNSDPYSVDQIKQTQLNVFNNMADCALNNKKYITRNDIKIPKDIKVINFPEIQIFEMIGDGTVANVYKGLYKGNEVAIKIMKNASLDDVELLFREAYYLNKIKANNVIGCYGICVFPKKECIVLQYINGGSLEQVLYNPHESLSFIRKLSIAINICTGIGAIHNEKLCHRAIKPKNILLTDTKTAYLSDFDCANAHTMTYSPVIIQGGDTLYVDPLIYRDHYSQSQKTDIYSFGIILCELFTRRKVFPYIQYVLLAYNPLYNLGGQKRPSTAEQETTRILEYTQNLGGYDPQEIYNYVRVLDTIHISIINLIKSAIDNNTQIRPTASQINQALLSIQSTPSVLYQAGIDHEDANEIYEALECHSFSSSLSYGRAAFRCGIIYSNQNGPYYNMSNAIQYFAYAAAGDSRDASKAAFNLGVIFETGLGVQKDIQKAREYYLLALSKGFPNREEATRALTRCT